MACWQVLRRRSFDGDASRGSLGFAECEEDHTLRRVTRCISLGRRFLTEGEHYEHRHGVLWGSQYRVRVGSEQETSCTQGNLDHKKRATSCKKTKSPRSTAALSKSSILAHKARGPEREKSHLIHSNYEEIDVALLSGSSSARNVRPRRRSFLTAMHPRSRRGWSGLRRM